MLNQLNESTVTYGNSVSKEFRKKIGQFFTPPTVAEFMGNLMHTSKSAIRLLDAGAEVLYVGDTAKKDLIKNKEKLQELGVRITDHDKLPDVVLYIAEKDWLYFVEAVTSVGPVSVKRMNEIQGMLGDCTSGIVYITAFLDMSSRNGFKKFIDQIAWETEVWVADNPDHLIHLNGDRFLGPR